MESYRSNGVTHRRLCLRKVRSEEALFTRRRSCEGASRKRPAQRGWQPLAAQPDAAECYPRERQHRHARGEAGTSTTELKGKTSV